VYGVGLQKPSISGLIDLNSPGFKVTQESVKTPKPLFFNTGVLKTNPELADMPLGLSNPELKFN
jgi:hypothetical protein